MSFFESWLCRDRIVKTLPTNSGPPAGTCSLAEQRDSMAEKGNPECEYVLGGAGSLIVMKGKLYSPDSSETGDRIQMSCILQFGYFGRTM